MYFGLSLVNSLNMFGVFSVLALDCKECVFLWRGFRSLLHLVSGTRLWILYSKIFREVEFDRWLPTALGCAGEWLTPVEIRKGR